MWQLRFGGIGGFLTPNVADTRNPLVVVLHAGCVAHPDGGFTKEGETESFRSLCSMKIHPCQRHRAC